VRDGLATTNVLRFLRYLLSPLPQGGDDSLIDILVVDRVAEWWAEGNDGNEDGMWIRSCRWPAQALARARDDLPGGVVFRQRGCVGCLALNC